MAKQECAGCGTVHDKRDMVPMSTDDLSLLDDGPVVLDESSDLDLLKYLMELRRVRDELDRDERLVVEALRNLGVGWGKIAYRLGQSKSTVYRRYEYLGGDE